MIGRLQGASNYKASKYKTSKSFISPSKGFVVTELPRNRSEIVPNDLRGQEYKKAPKGFTRTPRALEATQEPYEAPKGLMRHPRSLIMKPTRVLRGPQGPYKDPKGLMRNPEAL